MRVQFPLSAIVLIADVTVDQTTVFGIATGNYPNPAVHIATPRIPRPEGAAPGNVVVVIVVVQPDLVSMTVDVMISATAIVPLLMALLLLLVVVVMSMLELLEFRLFQERDHGGGG